MYDLSNAGGVEYNETENYSYDSWFSTPGLSDLDEYRIIRYHMNQENLLLHWKYAYLEITGQLYKKAGQMVKYTADDKISFIHNSVPHLFTNAKFTVGNKTVETVNLPGYASSLMNNVLYPRSLQKNAGLQFNWVADTTKDANSENKGWEIRRKRLLVSPSSPGAFKLRMPLSNMFGFCQNMVPLRGYPIEVELVRGMDATTLFLGGETVPGKLKITAMRLNIPVVTPNNKIQLETLKGLTNPKSYLYSFRAKNCMFAPIPKSVTTFQLSVTSDSMPERPQQLFVGLQRNTQTPPDNQKFNHSLFSHEDVLEMVVKMNNCQIPEKPIPANWKNADSGFFYEAMLHQRANFLQFPGTYSDNTFLNPENFEKMYTIFCFDVTKQQNLLSARTVNCELHTTFRTPTNPGIKMYVAWYFDRTLELFSDGKSINIKSQTTSYSHS